MTAPPAEVAAAAKLQGRALLDLFLDQSPTAMSLTRASDGRFLEANGLFCEVYGRRREEILGRTARDLRIWIEPQLRDPLVDELRQAGRIRAHEFLMRRGDGAVRNVVVSLDLVEVDGDPCILASSLDVTPLRETERAAARMLRAIDTSPDSILTVDEKGIIVTWNRGSERLYGYAASEVVGRHGDFLIPEEMGDEPRWLAERLLAGETVQDHETRRRRKDGTLVDVSLTISPVVSHEGKLQGYTGISRDITDRKRAEAQTRAQHETEERFRRAVHDAAIGIAIFDLQGRYLDVNEALAEMLGYTREELLSTDWKRITHPDDLAPTLALAPEVNSAMHRGVRHRKRYLHKDGRVVIAEVVVSPVRNDEGEVVQYVTQIADVTARVAADEALRREQRLLAESQAASHVGSWEFVPGRGGMWSDEMYRIFGLAPQSTPASFEAFLGHVHPSDVPALRELGRDPAVGEQDVDFRVVRSDGSIAWVATHARIERGPDGRPTRFVGTTLDITDRRRAEEERRKQMVQRKLVRRMLRDLVARGPASMTTRRDLGKALASEATSHDASGFVDAFAALNIGTLQVDRVGEGRYEARARDLLEVTPRFGSPTCHIALGFLEGMVAMLEEGTSLGAEVRCQSQGHEECLFVVKARPKP